jgi:membrane-associated PAP2 superfamily phosphatase
LKKEVISDFLLPIVIVGVLTAIFWLTNLDITLEEYFYSPDKGWFLKRANPWHFLYEYGNRPGLTLGIVSLVALVTGLFSKRIVRYRKIAMFLVLVLVIGPGIITHSVFKKNWGRPRPRHIVNFGGTETFLPVWVKGTSGKGKSFPSGHATIGYYVLTPFFVLRRVNKKWAVITLIVGVGYGSLMGIGRMIQGAHFASDVLWSCGFTYLTGLLFYYFMRFDKNIWWESSGRKGIQA